MDFETLVKVIVVGNGGVGKSSMAARYCKGIFTSTYKKTIGVDYLEKTIETDSGDTVKVMVWDTAGQEEYDAITSSYYRGAGACALVFSTTDRASFDAVEKWKRKVEDNCGRVVMALVQNKIDLMDQAVMTDAEVTALAAKLKLPLFKTCVKDDINVGDMFEYLAGQFILKGGDTSGVSSIAAIGDYSASNLGSSNLSASTGSVSAPKTYLAESDADRMGDSDAKDALSSSGAVEVAVDERDADDEEARNSYLAQNAARNSHASQNTATAKGPTAAGSGANALPPPATTGAFKLTAEPKIKPKRSWC